MQHQRPRDSDLGMARGSIKFYSKDKGFGFIAMEDGRDCFFHFTGIGKDQLPDDLKHDAEVTFRLWKQNGENARGNGLKATDVRVTHL